MPDPQRNSGSQLDKSLLLEYRERMVAKKELVEDEDAREQIEQVIDLVDDLQDLFEYG